MIIKVEDIEFSYNSTPVLNGVTFEVIKGEVLAIIGPNGAGKSTLLKCMNGILKPKKGTVMVEETPLDLIGYLELARIMGYVPQNVTASFMTVFDTVLLGRKPYIRWEPDGKDLQIVEETLIVMGLEKKALTFTRELSGGELQKVMLARALVQRPKVLFLDEPTCNLDLKNQLEVMRIIKGIVRNKAITSIVVMHDINLALRFADRFLAMKDGIVYHQGNMDSITPEFLKDVYGINATVERFKDHTIIIPL
ncbi:MAG: ABC transporter ATP-binding protein [Spirochaetota bacterium]